MVSHGRVPLPLSYVRTDPLLLQDNHPLLLEFRGGMRGGMHIAFKTRSSKSTLSYLRYRLNYQVAGIPSVQMPINKLSLDWMWSGGGVAVQCSRPPVIRVASYFSRKQHVKAYIIPPSCSCPLVSWSSRSINKKDKQP